MLAGEGFPVAEDFGGLGGWHGLKQAYKKPDSLRNERGWFEDVGGEMGRDGSELWKRNIIRINKALKKLKVKT